MSSLLDLITGAVGLPNPLNATPQTGGPQNSYALAAQLAATPQQQANPNYVQGAQLTNPNEAGPSISPTQPNPAYAALQKQEGQAFANDETQARSMALLNAAGAMLSARNPYGGPASFGEALGAGIPAGIQGLTQAEQRNLLKGRGLLEAQNVGRQGALAQQQLQQGQYQLNDMQRFSQLLGFSTPTYANAYLARLNGQAAAQQLQGMLSDPKLSQDTKNRILMAMPSVASGMMKPGDIIKNIFGSAIGPEREKLIEQQTKTSATAATRNTAAANALKNVAGGASTKDTVAEIIRVGGPEVASAVQEQTTGKVTDPHLANAISIAKRAKVSAGDTFEVADDPKNPSGPKHKYISLGDYVVPYSSGIAGYEAKNKKLVNDERLTAALAGDGTSDLGAIDAPP